MNWIFISNNVCNPSDLRSEVMLWDPYDEKHRRFHPIKNNADFIDIIKLITSYNHRKRWGIPQQIMSIANLFFCILGSFCKN